MDPGPRLSGAAGSLVTRAPRKDGVPGIRGKDVGFIVRGLKGERGVRACGLSRERRETGEAGPPGRPGLQDTKGRWGAWCAQGQSGAPGKVPDTVPRVTKALMGGQALGDRARKGTEPQELGSPGPGQ